jgi:hypothetical protein
LCQTVERATVALFGRLFIGRDRADREVEAEALEDVPAAW